MTISLSHLPKHIISALLATTASLSLMNCGHQSREVIEVYETVGYQPHFGPFDHNGNYVDKWADNPPRRKYIPRDQPKSKSQPNTPKPQYVSTQPKPKPTYTAPQSSAPKHTSSPKKAIVAKPKKKPPITHTVRKGDTLYGLSRKYSTSISSIQRANKLRGTIIVLGQRLIIPR